MKKMLSEQAVWSVVFALVGVGATLFAYGHAPLAAAQGRRGTSSPPYAPTQAALPITQIVLERVGGGPQFKWQKIDITLQRPANTNYREADVFTHLSHWLETSGFFARKSGYVDPAKLFPADVGHLRIKVTRGGQVTQVWSYNGQRDDELWETETMIRGAEATIARYKADQARMHEGSK